MPQPNALSCVPVVVTLSVKVAPMPPSLLVQVACFAGELWFGNT